MPLIKKYNQCELHDGGFGRRILYIPKSLFDSLVIAPRDRDSRDTIARLFAQIHNGSRPLWMTLYESAYAVEMGHQDTDTEIKKFVNLIEHNQTPSHK